MRPLCDLRLARLETPIYKQPQIQNGIHEYTP